MFVVIVGKMRLILKISLPTLSIKLYRISNLLKQSKKHQQSTTIPCLNKRLDFHLSPICCFWVILFSKADAKSQQQAAAGSSVRR